MIITGLDPSLRATGWCRLTSGHSLAPSPSAAAEFGTITPPKGMTGLARMELITGDILIRLSHSERPRLVVVEGFSFGSRGRALFEIAGLGYAVRLEMFRRAMRFIVVPPATLKKFVTGKGTAQKSMMLREVYRRWGIAVNDDNEADAVGLAQIGAALLDYATKPLTAFQREVISKLRKDSEVQRVLAQFEAHT